MLKACLWAVHKKQADILQKSDSFSPQFNKNVICRSLNLGGNNEIVFNNIGSFF